MIVPGKYISKGEEFDISYSDQGFIIKKIGTDEFYEKAIDLPNTNFEYEETEELINEEEATEQDYLQALNELGVE